MYPINSKIHWCEGQRISLVWPCYFCSKPKSKLLIIFLHSKYMYLSTQCSVVYVKLHVIGMLFGKVLKMNFYLGRGNRRKGDLFNFVGFFLFFGVFFINKIAISCAILFFFKCQNWWCCILNIVVYWVGFKK